MYLQMTAHELSDEDERDHWERLLSTQMEVEFREFVYGQIPIRPDDSVLSVGCGPGFETEAIAERLGEEGTLTGIDVNEATLAAAEERCSDLSQVSFQQGDITDLPVADESHDLAIAKQVFYAVSDVEAALEELARVVKPGGRVAATAVDRRAHITHTPTDRMERADEVYRSRMSERQLGTRLVGLLPEAGLTVEEVLPRAKTQTELNDQVEHGIEVQRGFLEASDAFDDEEVDAWEQELRELAEAGQFLSCSTTFLYIARKSQ